MRKLITPLVFVAGFVLAGNASALTISTTTDATTLANEILGTGVNILSASYIGEASQSGTFSGDTVLGMGSGIILTSGDANLAVGPNTDSGTTGDFGAAGDADLDLITAPNMTNDAAVLEIEFEFDGGVGGDLFFSFAFASEEYNEYIDDGFNDVFALFVDGTNVALAPDGNPVSIDNVNCGNPFVGAGPNCDIFNNNEGGAFDIEYDGFTDVLLAEALGLSAGTHTLKIAIADTGDDVLDSAVFIQADSLSDAPSLPEPASLALMGLGILGLAAVRRRRSA